MSEHYYRPGKEPAASTEGVWRWYRPMKGRSVTEAHRAATPLELFFDLCFVVAVAQAGRAWEHEVAEHHLVQGALGFLVVLFAIWWAWMNFTWFASAYDTDDAPYRVATLVQITGALILAAGVPEALSEQHFTVPVIGYVVMRIAMVAQWLRAAASHPERRTTALRYALGITFCQAGWLGWLAVPGAGKWAYFAFFAVCEVLVPAWAERAGETPWHPHHIVERYGLFTIILLGETATAVVLAIQAEMESPRGAGELAMVIVGAVLIAFSMWWLYFAVPAHQGLTSLKSSLLWGYGHYGIFAAVAAVGPGIVLDADDITGEVNLDDTLVASLVTVPTAVYVLLVWALHLRPHLKGVAMNALYPCIAGLVLAMTFTPRPVLFSGIVMAVGVVVPILAHPVKRSAVRD